MDDLSATISKILADPDSMRHLQQAAASLGLSGGGQTDTPSPPSGGSGQGGSRQSSQPLNWTMGGSGRGKRNNQPGRQPERTPPPQQNDNDIAYIKTMLERLVENTSPPPAPLPAPPQPPASAGLDLSALSGILSGLGGGEQSAPPPVQAEKQSAPDLSALSGILSGLGGGPGGTSGPDLGALSGLLGGLGGSTGSTGGPDLGALSGLLGGLGGNSGNSGGPDLGALSGLLGGLGKQGAPPSPSGVSALTAMLGGNDNAPPSTGGGGMNMNMLAKFQQAMSGISANAENVRLMMALKGQLKDQTRIAKIDDAVKVMQVIQFLPILKETGIFGKFDEILSGLSLGGRAGEAGGGLGSVLGNLTGGRSGLGGLLSSLTGRR